MIAELVLWWAVLGIAATIVRRFGPVAIVAWAAFGHPPVLVVLAAVAIVAFWVWRLASYARYVRYER